MAIFDDLTKKAAKLTETAIDKTQDLADEAMIKLKMKNIETDRDEVYCELGKYYFDLIKDKNSIDENIAELRSKIFEYEEELKELAKELEEQK